MSIGDGYLITSLAWISLQGPTVKLPVYTTLAVGCPKAPQLNLSCRNLCCVSHLNEQQGHLSICTTASSSCPGHHLPLPPTQLFTQACGPSFLNATPCTSFVSLATFLGRGEPHCLAEKPVSGSPGTCCVLSASCLPQLWKKSFRV